MRHSREMQVQTCAQVCVFGQDSTNMGKGMERPRSGCHCALCGGRGRRKKGEIKK